MAYVLCVTKWLLKIMKHYSIKAFLLIFFISPLSIAEESNTDKTEKEQMLFIADEFAKCVGVYRSASMYMKKHSADESQVAILDGNARGAMVASEYILSAYKSDGKKPLGYYEDYVESVAYSSQIKMDSLFSMADKEAEEQKKFYMGICADLNPLQAKIIQEFRKQVYLNQE